MTYASRNAHDARTRVADDVEARPAGGCGALPLGPGRGGQGFGDHGAHAVDVACAREPFGVRDAAAADRTCMRRHARQRRGHRAGARLGETGRRCRRRSTVSSAPPRPGRRPAGRRPAPRPARCRSPLRRAAAPPGAAGTRRASASPDSGPRNVTLPGRRCRSRRARAPARHRRCAAARRPGRRHRWPARSACREPGPTRSGKWRFGPAATPG